MTEASAGPIHAFLAGHGRDGRGRTLAAVLAFGLLTKRNFLQIVLGTVLALDETGWRKLTLRWAVFFVVLAVINEIVWRNFSTDTWVNFKVFGIMPLTILFTMTQLPLIMRERVKPEEEPVPR